MSEPSAEPPVEATATAEQPTTSLSEEEPPSAVAGEDAATPTTAAPSEPAEGNDSPVEESTAAAEEADDAAVVEAAEEGGAADAAEDDGGVEAEEEADAPAQADESANATVANAVELSPETAVDGGPSAAAEADAAELELERYDQLVKDGQQQQQLSMTQEEADTDVHLAAEPIAAPDPAIPPPFIAAIPSPSSSSSSSQPATLDASSPTCAVPEAMPPPPRSPSPPSSPSLPSHSALDAARSECDALQAVNRARQRQIALFLDHQHRHAASSTTTSSSSSSSQPSAAPPASHSSDDPSDPSHPIKTDYIKLLTQIHALWDELSSKQERSESAIAQLIEQLNAQDARGEALASSLHDFQVEMARTAVDRHGNALSMKGLERMQAEERALNKQLADVRLHYLTQQAKVEGLQAAIRAKEELAEGLHLIDFEQLKIENATLHEKVEERNDELYKLGKKKNAAVEVLTHVREKVWWVWEENEQLRGGVEEEESGIQTKRREMKAVKKVREELRRENEALKVKEGFVGVDALVLDYERRKEALKVVRREVEERQKAYHAITSSTQTGKRRPSKAEEAKEQLRFNISGAGLTRTLKKRK